MCRETPAATSAPPPTGSDPPSQKSFCTSTTISAVRPAMPLLPSISSVQEYRRDRRLAAGQRESLPRHRDERVAQVVARLLEGRQAVDRGAAAQQRHWQQPVVLAERGRPRRPEGNLLDRRPGRLVPAQGRLAAAARLLGRAALGDRAPLDLDELVDHA